MIGKAGKTLFVLVAVLFGCGNTADISDEPVMDDPKPPRRTSAADAGKSLPKGGEDASEPASQPSNEAGALGIECLGKKLDAWACEGFEGAAAPLAPFTVQTSNGQATRVANRALGGGASLRTAFDPIPVTGKAGVSFTKQTSTVLGMAVQLSVYIEDDAHDIGKDVLLATLSGGNAKATLSFMPTVSGNVFELRAKTGAGETKYNLGPAPKNGWVCIEIEADKQDALRVWRGSEPKVNARLEGAAQLSRAEVGIEWLHGPNANASKAFWFDDVIVAPRAVGCLH